MGIGSKLLLKRFLEDVFKEEAYLEACARINSKCRFNAK